MYTASLDDGSKKKHMSRDMGAQSLESETPESKKEKGRNDKDAQKLQGNTIIKAQTFNRRGLLISAMKGIILQSEPDE